MATFQRAVTEQVQGFSNELDYFTERRARARSLPAIINRPEINNIIGTTRAREHELHQSPHRLGLLNNEEAKWEFVTLVSQTPSSSPSIDFVTYEPHQKLSSLGEPISVSQQTEIVRKRGSRCDLDVVSNRDETPDLGNLEDQSTRQEISQRRQLEEEKTTKRLKPIPPNAPRSIVTKGRFTFRKGVRIYDYQVPRYQVTRHVQSSRAFQCRDGFDDAVIPLEMSQIMARQQQLPNIRRRGFKSIPESKALYLKEESQAQSTSEARTLSTNPRMRKGRDQEEDKVRADAFDRWIQDTSAEPTKNYGH